MESPHPFLNDLRHIFLFSVFLVDIDPCGSQPCVNGGSCSRDGATGYRCITSLTTQRTTTVPVTSSK